VVTLRDNEIAATRTRLCAAAGKVRPEETAVHGLDAPALQGSAPFKEEWKYFADLRAAGPLAAHFAQAENHLLKSMWAYPRTAPDFARPGKTATELGPVDRYRPALSAILSRAGRRQTGRARGGGRAPG